MQPLSPKQKEALLNKGVTLEEIEEYERLLANQFTRDPDTPEDAGDKKRLAELAKKLFP